MGKKLEGWTLSKDGKAAVSDDGMYRISSTIYGKDVEVVPRKIGRFDTLEAAIEAVLLDRTALTASIASRRDWI